MSHSPRTYALLEAARREVDPSPAELARVRAQLASRLAEEEPTPVPVPFPWLLLAGGLLGLASLGLAAWLWPSKPAALAAGPTCPPAVVCPVVPVAVSAPACPTPVPALPAARAVTPEACRPRPPATVDDGEGGPSSRRGVDTVLADEEANRWALELGLLIDARVALDESRPLDALGHTRRHAQLFPQSTFLEERLALEVLATCQFGRPDLAAQKAALLQEVESDSTYVPRIRQGCGWEELPVRDGGGDADGP